MTAAQAAADLIGGNSKGAQKKEKRAAKAAKKLARKDYSAKNGAEVESQSRSQASAGAEYTENSVASDNSSSLADKMIPSVAEGCKVNQRAYLLAQTLIHRVYKKAYDLKCLGSELCEIWADFASQKFRTISDLTRKIKETILVNQHEIPQAEKLDAYVDD